MADYTIISDIGNALVKLLRSEMVPEVIQNADAIGLCSPADKGDLVLGLYLYDVRESEEVFETGMRTLGTGEQRYPSKFINLFYMVTAYSMSDIKFRASEEQRILGRAMQVLMDHAVLDDLLFGTDQARGRYPVRIDQLRLDNDEKMKLWNMPDVPYKLSLYYKVAPVEMESGRTRKIHRVRQIELDIQEKEQAAERGEAEKWQVSENG